MTISENHPLRLAGTDAPEDVILLRARVDEGISQLGATRIEFATVDKEINLSDLVGGTLQIELEHGGSGNTRRFHGLCVAAEYLGSGAGASLYAAELRPWLWVLSRRSNCLIFQDKTTPEILQDVLSEYGLWGEVQNELSGTYEKRILCVQYRETDLDFINRLMEEEGIYYHFDQSGETAKMVIADAVSAHQPVEWDPILTFQGTGRDSFSQSEYVSDWEACGRFTTGKVTLNDYFFEKPKASLKSTNSIPQGSHTRNELEAYMPPGNFTVAADGERLARIRMEAEAARYNYWSGGGNYTQVSSGRTFTLENHSRQEDNRDYMIRGATHLMRLDAADFEMGDFPTELSGQMDGQMTKLEMYRNTFQVVLKDTQFRAPLLTPWPEIPGVQTAVVTGPSGEEIYTDKFGRVRVRFHWHRDDPANETSTCWVRTMTPWTGKNWGMVALPRIGQEVVVQFEEGNPDRPVIIGMLYNADTMPPYGLPGNMTQSGVKTASSKGGDGYNELMFEDLKGAELVRFRSERDYEQLVQNNATISVGVETAEAGDMSLTVENNLTETVNKGDHSFEVKTGNQDIKIKTDKTETVEGKSTLTVTGNVSETVKTGNVTESVKQGNVTRTLDMGNEATTLKLGNYTLDAKLGKVTVTAMQAIELKVGGNSVVIDQMGVTIKGMMVKIEGQAMTEVKSPMTQVKGDGMLILKGGVTMIN